MNSAQKHRKNALVFAVILVFLCLIAAGCGGGSGASSTLINGGNISYAPLALKLQMLGNTSDAPGYAVPSTAAGEVSVTVTSLKDPARTVTKNASYGTGYIVFENQLLADDTYSVTVGARLKISSGETLEVWTGKVSAFKLHDQDDLIKNPEINTVFIGLQFSAYETIQIIPSKITFEPALPVSGLTPGASIPEFSIKMFDQYGFQIMSTSSPVTISLVNGSLAGPLTGNIIQGAAYFSGITASSLSPDASGVVYLKASYGSAYGLSAPIPASIVDAPNTTVAGYLDYTLNAKAAAPKAPAPGKSCSILVDGKQYDTTTDSNGFYKLDVRVNSSSGIAKLSVTGPSGAIESTEILIAPSKVYAALVTYTDPSSGNLAIKDIGAFGGVLPLDIIKAQLDQKIAEIRSSSAGATAISGRVVKYGAPSVALSGVTVSISPGGQSAVTDAGGFFKIAGTFPAASYVVTAQKSGFQSDSTQIAITANDYGFEHGGMNFTLAEQIIVKTLTSLSISPSSAQIFTGEQYGLGAVNAVAGYSDGTSAHVTPAWTVKSGAGSLSANAFTAPAAAGTTVLTASYTEGGITKTVDFTITISAKVTPSSLLLSKTQDTWLVGVAYDLAQIKATLYYSDNSSKEVAVTWAAKNGGSLVADKFTADTEGVFLLEASYTEGGSTLTAGISILMSRPVAYEGLLLSKNTDTMEVGANYDLAPIKGYALYSNLTTKEVTVSWSVESSASGSVSGSIYTAPASAGYYAIKASYTENGVSRESVFVMSVVDAKLPPTFTAQIISENTVKMTFSENIDISALNRAKIFLNSVALLPEDVVFKDTADSRSVYIKFAADFSVADQTNGIAAGPGKGLEFAAGCGVKSAVTGLEAVTASPVALEKDTVPPSAPATTLLSKLLFSNGQSFLLALDAINYEEMSQLEFFVSAAAAPDASTQPLASELFAVKGHAKSDVIISSFPEASGGNIYYRYRDRAGNLSQWSSYGVIPAPPAGAALTWSNAHRTVKVAGSSVAAEGDRLFVYYTQSGSTQLSYKGSSNAAPAGGFAPGAALLISDTPLPSGSTVSYSIMSPLNVESRIVADGTVPAPPIDITYHMRLIYDLPNYALMNASDTTSLTLANDLRVIIENTAAAGSPAEFSVLGRIAKGTVFGIGSTPSAGSYMTPESKDANGLNEFSGTGGYLKLSYVEAGSSPDAGNESEYVTSVPGNGVPGPAPVNYLSWDNAATSVKILNGFGYYNDVIKVFEVTSSGEIKYLGSTDTAPQGGFAAGATYTVGQTPIASTSKIAFAVRSADGNEGKISVKTVTAAAPESK